MATPLNFLSKHGILLSLLGMVLLLVMIVKASMNLKILVDEADFKPDTGKHVLRVSGFIVLYLCGIGLCGVFIMGIRKRREWYLLPLVIVGLIGSVYLSIVTVYDAVTIHYRHIDLVILATGVICFSIIVVYPMCMLFCEIRKENIEDRRRIQIRPQRV